MTTKFKIIYYFLLDLICTWLMPLFSFMSLISGAFLTYNMAGLRQLYPNWQRLFDIVEAYLPTWFILFASIAAVLNLIAALRRKSIRKLQKRLCDAESKNSVISENGRNLFDGILYNLSKKLSFDERDQSRISLYIHDSRGFFIPFGRYSPNPEYRRPGRSLYPDKEGCISNGWQNGWCFDNNLGRGNAYYKNSKNRYQMTKETLEGIKMRSILYAVKRIDYGNGNPLAVVVVESMHSDRFSEDYLLHALNGSIQDFAHVISALRDYIPNPRDAADRGFP